MTADEIVMVLLLGAERDCAGWRTADDAVAVAVRQRVVRELHRKVVVFRRGRSVQFYPAGAHEGKPPGIKAIMRLTGMAYVDVARAMLSQGLMEPPPSHRRPNYGGERVEDGEIEERLRRARAYKCVTGGLEVPDEVLDGRKEALCQR